MDGFEQRFIELAMSGIGAAVFALIGFVWKISHKNSDLEKRIEAIRELQTHDARELRKDIDYIISKVDNHNDKMYSIVKNMRE
tara:strand:- start:941 stop:1189 length:249 start_codon:yes stop_codon:yes gene_type:complete